MKVAILNDTHCGIRNSSDVFLNNSADFYDKVFFPYCREHDIKQIVHLGDVYDHRKFINFRALNHYRKHFLNKIRAEVRDMNKNYVSAKRLIEND